MKIQSTLLVVLAVAQVLLSGCETPDPAVVRERYYSSIRPVGDEYTGQSGFAGRKLKLGSNKGSRVYGRLWYVDGGFYLDFQMDVGGRGWRPRQAYWKGGTKLRLVELKASVIQRSPGSAYTTHFGRIYFTEGQMKRMKAEGLDAKLIAEWGSVVIQLPVEYVQALLRKVEEGKQPERSPG